MSLHPVYIAGTGSFLPGPPVPNDRLESLLGPLDRAPPRVKSFLTTLGPRFLERSGVESRHLAIDPETGDLTHTFAGLAEPACRAAMTAAGVQPDEVELLIISCPSYDQSTPPTSTLLQERLGIQTCAEMEIHSNCSGVGKAVQTAYDALRTGRYRHALVCYSQLSSVYLRHCYFNQEKMDKVNAALRWILADGAGALLLKAAGPGEKGHEILGTFVESVGAGRRAGMTAGGAVADLMKADRQIPELYAEGRHHLWQDFTAVNDNAGPLLLEGLLKITRQLKIEPGKVDHYIVSIPTRQLYDEQLPSFMDKLSITKDRIQFRSGKLGYTGGAATLVQLDAMVRGGEIKPGQLLAIHAVESSKWMTGGFVVRW
jgi:3-oxoacyl-[acyl-carrier-protein] synthase-3